MAKLIITGDGSSTSTDVTDAAHAVREVSRRLRKVTNDASVLKTMQKWADAGFKKPLRITIDNKAVVVDYRN